MQSSLEESKFYMKAVVLDGLLLKREEDSIGEGRGRGSVSCFRALLEESKSQGSCGGELGLGWS